MREHSSNSCALLIIYLASFCRGSAHQLQQQQQFLTASPHTKSILFIVPSSTHSCAIHLKHAHTPSVAPHLRARRSQKPAAKVTSNFVQHFQSGAAGHHGYTCNPMPHDLRVSAVFSFFHVAVSNFTRCFADIVASLLWHCCPWPLTCCARASAAIHSALRNLQMKIRRLELEKRQAELNTRDATRRDVSHTHLQSHKVTQTPASDPTGVERETGGQVSCNRGGCSRKMCFQVSDVCLYRVSVIVCSVDHSPGCCRVPLFQAGATAGGHEEAPGHSGRCQILSRFRGWLGQRRSFHTMIMFLCCH